MSIVRTVLLCFIFVSSCVPTLFAASKKVDKDQWLGTYVGSEIPGYEILEMKDSPYYSSMRTLGYTDETESRLLSKIGLDSGCIAVTNLDIKTVLGVVSINKFKKAPNELIRSDGTLEDVKEYERRVEDPNNREKVLGDGKEVHVYGDCVIRVRQSALPSGE